LGKGSAFVQNIFAGFACLQFEAKPRKIYSTEAQPQPNKKLLSLTAMATV